MRRDSPIPTPAHLLPIECRVENRRREFEDLGLQARPSESFRRLAAELPVWPGLRPENRPREYNGC